MAVAVKNTRLQRVAAATRWNALAVAVKNTLAASSRIREIECARCSGEKHAYCV